MTNTTPQSEWRCQRCDALLGVAKGDHFHLKYKRAQYIVSGPVLAVCPRCTHLNDTNDLAKPHNQTR